ncbi:MAG: HAMP domain-containing histidine kinase [Actinobacteria bacterium]|nr:HAMP domain-containing histidine kinase [Actinomycetota bacterium]MBU1609248.1 HAMP domain-containing histidine kinase [Actinomycetota bacterium]MBU2315786.1 HAMP domain-containing histidine kinase [Actinomycetota bacterium]
MTFADYAQVLAFAAGSALVAGLLAAVVLRLARRAPLVVHVIVIVAAAVGAVAGGIALTAGGMYINDSDTMVALSVTAASGVVSLAMALLLTLALSRDARGLGRDARRLGAGDTVEPARRVTAELDAVQGELVESSDRLAAARAASERAEAARRDLVARIAHDLLAPLASIRAIAETLEDGLSTEPERHAHQLGSHVTRLHALIGDLFELSRIDAGTLALAPETVSLTDLASDVVADFAPLAAQHDVILELAATDAVTAVVDAQAFSRALVNVVVNAIEHSPVGGVVTIAVDEHEGAGRVRVRDRGPGIAETDLPHVFEAGWRADAARTSPRLGLAGGAGLGLAITRAILEAHGGSASAARAEPGATGGAGGAGGAEFTLLLPRP